MARDTSQYLTERAALLAQHEKERTDAIAALEALYASVSRTWECGRATATVIPKGDGFEMRVESGTALGDLTADELESIAKCWRDFQAWEEGLIDVLPPSGKVSVVERVR